MRMMDAACLQLPASLSFNSRDGGAVSLSRSRYNCGRQYCQDCYHSLRSGRESTTLSKPLSWYEHRALNRLAAELSAL